MSLKSLYLAAYLVLASSLTWATACPEHFAGGQAPVTTNRAMSKSARQLCYDQFAVLHSGVTRTALWSAEKLTRATLSGAKGLVRQNDFHPDPRVPAGERAELRDYARSGYDRGHLSPSGNMGSMRAQQQSFTLANMIPQNPTNNRHLWEGIESAVRTYAKTNGIVYVITGPLFEGDRIKWLNSRVAVPTSIYKVVYDPQRGSAAAYVARNVDTTDYQVISVAALEARAGFNLMPGLSGGVKAKAMELPSPTPFRSRESAKNTHQPQNTDQAISLVANLMRGFTKGRF